MTYRHHDNIGDDEIRIIAGNDNRREGDNDNRGGRHIVGWIIAAVILAVVFIGLWAVFLGNEDDSELQVEVTETVEPESIDYLPVTADASSGAYVEITDTVAAGRGLVILRPVNASPSLRLGPAALNDTAAVLVAEAAGVRGDNGSIVGACVIDGELLSKGQSKAGFCAIINGLVTIGVADTTPFLEQALEADGSFFRQYPLVVGGQVVENRPKGVSLRKALAEYEGHTVVILSKERLSFHDFSEALARLGVSNAIYLVGSSSPAVARRADGERLVFGNPDHDMPANSTFITWK